MRKDTAAVATTAAWSSEDDNLDLLPTNDPNIYSGINRQDTGSHNRRDPRPGSLIMPSSLNKHHHRHQHNATGNGSTYNSSEPPSPTRSKAAASNSKPSRTSNTTNANRRLTSQVLSKELADDSGLSSAASSHLNIENIHPMRSIHRMTLASTTNLTGRLGSDSVADNSVHTLHSTQGKVRSSRVRSGLDGLESNESRPDRLSQEHQNERVDSRHQMHRSSSMGRQGGGTKEKGSRTICVCGASAYYERERFVLLKEKNRLQEESLRLKEQYRSIAANQKSLMEESNMVEQRRLEADRLRQNADDMMLAIEEVRNENEQMKKSLVRQKEQLDKSKENLSCQLLNLHSNREELDRKSSQLEKMHCELMSKKTELDERTIQLKKTSIRLEHQQNKLKQDAERLDSLRNELEGESERLAEERDALLQQEHTLEERRRSLTSREATLNEELSGLEDQKLCLDRRARELSQKELNIKNKGDELYDKIMKRENELNKLQRELDTTKAELDRARNEFEAEQRRLQDAFQADREQHSRQMAIDREDLESQIKLEKEWVQSERENIEKMKELSRQELQAEKDHTEEFLRQLRQKNTEQIDKERCQWKEDEKRLNDERTQQMNELQKFREEIKARETKLAQGHHQLMENKRKLIAEQDRFSERVDVEEERLAEAKLKVQTDQNDLRQRMLTLQEDERDLTLRTEKQREAEEHLKQSNELFNRKREQLESEMQTLRDRTRIITQREDQLSKRADELSEKENKLNEREEKLTTVEARAKWLQDVFKEVKDQQSNLLAEKEQLEWEKKQLEDGRKLLEHKKKRVTDQIQALQDNHERGPATPMRPFARYRAHTPKDSKKALPPLQVNMSAVKLTKMAQFSPQETINDYHSNESSISFPQQNGSTTIKVHDPSVGKERLINDRDVIQRSDTIEQPLHRNPHPSDRDNLKYADSSLNLSIGYTSDNDKLDPEQVDWVNGENLDDELNEGVPQVKRQPADSTSSQAPSYDVELEWDDKNAYSMNYEGVQPTHFFPVNNRHTDNKVTDFTEDHNPPGRSNSDEYVYEYMSSPLVEETEIDKLPNRNTGKCETAEVDYLNHPSFDRGSEHEGESYCDSEQQDVSQISMQIDQKSSFNEQTCSAEDEDISGVSDQVHSEDEDLGAKDAQVTERTCFSMGSAVGGEEDDGDHYQHRRLPKRDLTIASKIRSSRELRSISTASNRTAVDMYCNKENEFTSGQQPNSFFDDDLQMPTSTRSMVVGPLQRYKNSEVSKPINRHIPAGLLSGQRYLSPFHEVSD